ncbi:hypothetical protein ABRZ24_20155 [Brenneria populi]|uniref:Uncharacterized protein n=1 Tax=Brenneria populi TaxID=1505588 RepID=A0ABU6JW40_9GAMM|nr:hypothetical protein [Brenneria populi Li et al. 2015]
MRARVVDDRLVLSDLRMGLEPVYIFNFVVAERADGRWREIVPEELNSDGSDNVRRSSAAIWRRIWREPPAPAGGDIRAARQRNPGSRATAE